MTTIAVLTFEKPINGSTKLAIESRDIRSVLEEQFNFVFVNYWERWGTVQLGLYEEIDFTYELVPFIKDSI